MNAVYIVLVAIVIVCTFWAWRTFGSTHSEGLFVAKASGALFDLGLDVKRLPAEAKQHFFREGHAIYEATKDRPSRNRYNPKRFAMRFFGWYSVEYKMPDPKAFLRDGVLAGSISTMRQWARKEPDLSEAAEKEVKLIFNYLYRSFETMKAPKETILGAQLKLLEIMKDTDVKL
jgi:hypothetical protein